MLSSLCLAVLVLLGAASPAPAQAATRLTGEGVILDAASPTPVLVDSNLIAALLRMNGTLTQSDADLMAALLRINDTLTQLLNPPPPPPPPPPPSQFDSGWLSLTAPDTFYG